MRGRGYWGGIPQLASSPPPSLVLEPFHHTQCYLGAPPSHPPRKPVGPSTLLDYLWSQANRKVVPLRWAFLRRLQTARPIFQVEKLSQSNPAAPQGFLLDLTPLG